MLVFMHSCNYSALFAIIIRWSAHLDFVLKKAVKSFNILFRLKSTLHTNLLSLSLIYKTYILPIIECACLAVTPLSIAALDGLERIQRKAARICLRLPLYTPLNHSTLLHRLKWPTMFSRRKVKLTLLAHSIKYQYAPQVAKTHMHAQHPRSSSAQYENNLSATTCSFCLHKSGLCTLTFLS